VGYGAIYQFVMMFPDRVVSKVEDSCDSIKCVRASDRTASALCRVWCGTSRVCHSNTGTRSRSVDTRLLP